MLRELATAPPVEPDALPGHGTLRTFLAPCLLVAASVLTLAGITAAANRPPAPTGQAQCIRVAPQSRSTCP